MQGTAKNGIYYEIEGEGPWMTLSHSLACDIHMWDPQMDLLTKHFKVLRFDTRGHGKSVVPQGPYTMEQLADDVYDLFGELGITKTHWMGLSMGGMIGQTLALKHPEICTSLVLADTTSRRPDNALKMWGDRIITARNEGMQGVLESTMQRWFTEPFRIANSAAYQATAQGVLNTPVEGFAGCCEAISRIDTFDRLPELKCPVLIMVGSDDHGTPPEMARKIHAQIPQSVLHIIDQASHISNVEQTATFNQHLIDFYQLS
jgi:3-oxoadipate enol-lactonase